MELFEHLPLLVKTSPVVGFVLALIYGYKLWSENKRLMQVHELTVNESQFKRLEQEIARVEKESAIKDQQLEALREALNAETKKHHELEILHIAETAKLKIDLVKNEQKLQIYRHLDMWIKAHADEFHRMDNQMGDELTEMNKALDEGDSTRTPS